MPQLEQISPTTYKIVSGRDSIEIGNIDDIKCLAHLKYKRWHGNSEFTLSYPGSPTGLAKITNSTLTIEYGDVDVELTAHEPDSENPDGRSEFNVILKSKPTPDVNGDYWQVLNFESTGLNFERVLGLDEELSQERCHEKWYLDLYDNHEGNNLYGHDNGTGIFVRTSTEIRTPDGEVVLKSKPEHLVHSLLGTAIKNTHKKSNMGEIKANTPNKGKQLIYATISRDHARLPRRELIDAKGQKARIEDVQLVGNQLKFKLPKDFIEKAKYPVQHVTGLDPAYTEDMDFWVTDYGSDGSWSDYDLFTNHGVPKGAVAEIIIANVEPGNEMALGVRTDGSSVDRRVTIHECEGGGYTTCRMFVVCHADTGLVETNSEDVSDDCIFYLVGYWGNVGFTEQDDRLDAGGDIGSWFEKELADSGAASRVCHILLENVTQDTAVTIGTRNTSSSLERKVLVHEPETGGWSILDMLVKADASYKIDLYKSTFPYIHNFGYFGEELDFVELFQSIANDGDGDWDAEDLTAYLDEDGRVVDFLLTHDDKADPHFLGVRGGDDGATNRYIQEHESEDNGSSTGEVTGFGISAQSNASGIVNLYADTQVGKTGDAVFYLMGYFKPAEVGAPVVVTPPAANLILTTYVPIVTVTLNQLVTPAAANLILTTYAPTVSVGVGLQTLTGAAVAVTSSVQTAVISGSGDAPLTASPITVTSSVVAAEVGFVLRASAISVTSSVVQAAIDFAQQYLASSPVPVTSSVVQAGIAGSGAAPLAGTSIGVTSSIVAAAIAGTGLAPLAASPVSVTSSVVSSSVTKNLITAVKRRMAAGIVPFHSVLLPDGTIGIKDRKQIACLYSEHAGIALQELIASPVTVTSSVVTAAIAGAGIAPLTSSSVSVTSSVVTAVLAGSGNAPLAGTPVSVTTGVVSSAVSFVMRASAIAVVSSVQAASIAGSGIAPLTASPVSITTSVPNAFLGHIQELVSTSVAVTSSVVQATISGLGIAPLSGVAISVTSSVVSAAIAGTGIAPLGGTAVSVTSSVVQAEVGFILKASPVTVTSSIQTAAIAGSGNAPLAGAALSVASSVQQATIAGSGNAPLAASSVAVTSSVVAASVGFILKASAVAVTSSVQQATISGSGNAPLTTSPLGIHLSVGTGVVTAEVGFVLRASPVAVTSSVVAASIAGSGTAPLLGAAIGVSSSVVSATLAGTGIAPLAASPIGVASSVVSSEVGFVLRAAAISVTSSVVTASISGSGNAPLVASAVAVTSSVVSADIGFILKASPVAVTTSVNTASISGIGIAPLTASAVSVASSIVTAKMVFVLRASAIAVASSVVTANVGFILRALPVAVAFSIVRATVSGIGIAPLTGTVIAVASSVKLSTLITLDRKFCLAILTTQYRNVLAVTSQHRSVDIDTWENRQLDVETTTHRQAEVITTQQRQAKVFTIGG